MTGRAERLRQFCADLEGEPVIWGASGNDCCSFAASWIRLETGLTPRMPDYHDEDGARRLLLESDMRQLWADALEPIGIRETFEPQIGDVGLVRLAIGLTGCIVLTHGRVALRARETFTYMLPRQPLVAAYAVPDRK
jgi:hypothetical protein